VRVLLAFKHLRAMVEDRPIGQLARRLQPDYPGPVPRFLPPVWL